MIRTTTTFASLVLLATLVVAAPAFADDAAGVASDVNAIHKDNSALAKDDAEMAKDRAIKAKDKATGNWTGQAVDSVTLGADHVMKGEKSAEKSTDQNVLNHDTTPSK